MSVPKFKREDEVRYIGGSVREIDDNLHSGDKFIVRRSDNIGAKGNYISIKTFDGRTFKWLHSEVHFIRHYKECLN